MRNVSKNILIKFFKMILPNNLNVIYTKFVEVEDLYFVAENHFQIHALAFV